MDAVRADGISALRADNARPYSYTIKRPVFFKTGRCFYGEALEKFQKGKAIFQIFF